MKSWAVGFYQSRDWKACRETFLTMRFYICERCGGPAKIAHHKKYLTPKNIHDYKVSLSYENLEALCQDCHNKEHHRGDGKKNSRYHFDKFGNVIINQSPPIK